MARHAFTRKYIPAISFDSRRIPSFPWGEDLPFPPQKTVRGLKWFNAAQICLTADGVNARH
jgi:hypothetical protein